MKHFLSLIGGLLPGKPQIREIICYVLPVSSELRQERSFNWQRAGEFFLLCLSFELA